MRKKGGKKRREGREKENEKKNHKVFMRTDYNWICENTKPYMKLSYYFNFCWWSWFAFLSVFTLIIVQVQNSIYMYLSIYLYVLPIRCLPRNGSKRVNRNSPQVIPATRVREIPNGTKACMFGFKVLCKGHCLPCSSSKWVPWKFSVSLYH